MTKKEIFGRKNAGKTPAAMPGPGFVKPETGKPKPNPGDQGPHGGGEGLTGMQPGAGHPRGR